MSMSKSTRSCGDVDLQRLARVVDEVERRGDHVLRLLDEAQRAAVALGPAVDHVLRHDLGLFATGEPTPPKMTCAPLPTAYVAISSAFSENHSGQMRDRRQPGDVVAEAAGRDHVGEDRQDAGVVDAAAHVQHRRDADASRRPRASDVAGELHRLGGEQAVLAARDRGAAGHDHEHVVGDELAHDVDDRVVLDGARARAADDRRHAADPAVDDVLVERRERGAHLAAEHVADVLVAEAGDERLGDVGDVDRRSRFGKFSIAWRTIARAASRGLCSSTTICSESPMHAFGLEEMSLVWKCAATSVRPWKMHCTSTTIASTAPVRIASSWWSMLPAGGTPLRMSDSLAVQQMPATLMPLAPTVSASSIISGSRVASMIIEASSGSWPWMRMLTLSSESTPRFACAADRLRRAVEDVLQVGGEHRAAPAARERALDRAVEQRLVVLVGAGVRCGASPRRPRGRRRAARRRSLRHSSWRFSGARAM